MKNIMKKLIAIIFFVAFAMPFIFNHVHPYVAILLCTIAIYLGIKQILKIKF
jgi:hypothetical protein